MCTSCLLKNRIGQAEFGGPAAHERERRLRRFFHDVAELAGERELAGARHHRRLDEQDVAADRRPARPVATPFGRGSFGDLGEVPLFAEIVGDVLRRDRRAANFGSDGDLARDLAADRSRSRARDCARRLRACSSPRSRRSRLRVIAHCRAVSPLAFELLRHQVLARDRDFLGLRVAGEVDDLHAIAQRRRDRVQLVGRRDEEHFAQIERQVEVVVAERVVLLGVEHFEQRRRRIAAEIGAHLVDLVDHDQRVAGAGVADRADERARHRADVRAPVTANLGLVADAADRQADELAVHRARDRFAQRGLADAGRPDEAQDRPDSVFLQLAHREVLEDAVLDFLEVVVVLVQNGAGLVDVEASLRSSPTTAASRANRDTCG